MTDKEESMLYKLAEIELFMDDNPKINVEFVSKSIEYIEALISEYDSNPDLYYLYADIIDQYRHTLSEYKQTLKCLTEQ